MTDSRFWRSWPSDVRLPFLLLLGLALVTILWSIYEYLTGPDRAIPWITETTFDSVPIIIDRFSRLVQTFDIQASGYLISERYNAGLPVISSFAGNFYLVMLALALVFYLAAITTLKRIPYAIGMLLFMLLLGSFNADALDLLQSTRNYFLIGSLIVFGLLSYYFQAFVPNTSFTFRLISLAAVMLAAAVFVYLRSAYDAYTTTLHLIGHSAPGVMVGGLIYALLVSFDNIKALLWLNGQGTSPQQRAGLGRFLGVGLLYLLSLAFIYLANTGYFRVDVSFITPFFLLVVSFVVGLWGFRQREAVFGSWLPYRPAGAMLYLCFAMFAFLGAGYAFGTFNDPVTAAFNDMVLLTHLAFGLLFFVYVFVNFSQLIRARLPVYKVVYQPKKMPFFSVYAGGIILFMALVLYTGGHSFYQAQAGYYNYLGDLYAHEGNDLLAERYYEEGNLYENNNVRSNLNLAAIADKKGFSTAQVQYLRRSLIRRPKEKMYVRLANAYSNKNLLFDAMFVTREGLERYPKSHRLNNNMALLFSQTDVIDSMAIYIDRAQALSGDDLIKNNSLALLLKSGMFDVAVQVAGNHINSKYEPLQSNIELLNLQTGNQPSAENRADLRTRKLDNGSFALLYHQELAQLPQSDTVRANALAKLAETPGNEAFTENLNLLRAFILHYHGGRADARKSLEELVVHTAGNEGYYHHLLGLWLLEEKLDLAAADAFERAKESGFAPAYLHHAYALALAGQNNRAVNEAQRVLTSNNPSLIKQSVDLQQLLEASPTAFTTTQNDTLRAQQLELYSKRLPPEVQIGAIQSIKTPELKAPAMAALAERLINAGRLPEAEMLLEQLQNQTLANQLAEGEYNRLQASLLYARKQHQLLLKFLDEAPFGLGYEGLKTYYRAASLWAMGRPNEAAPLFAQVPNLVPYHAEAIKETARFNAQQLNQPMQAYDLLLSGIAYNPHSTELMKAYTLQAVDLNLISYAENTLDRLSELLDAREFATFKQQYDQRLAQREEAGDNW